MGAYSAWLYGIFSDRVRPARVVLERTLVIADFEPTPLDLAGLLGGMPRSLALPAESEAPIAGVEYFRFRTGTNPIHWDGGAEAFIRERIDTDERFGAPVPVD